MDRRDFMKTLGVTLAAGPALVMANPGVVPKKPNPLILVEREALAKALEIKAMQKSVQKGMWCCADLSTKPSWTSVRVHYKDGGIVEDYDIKENGDGTFCLKFAPSPHGEIHYVTIEGSQS